MARLKINPEFPSEASLLLCTCSTTSLGSFIHNLRSDTAWEHAAETVLWAGCPQPAVSTLTLVQLFPLPSAKRFASAAFDHGNNAEFLSLKGWQMRGIWPELKRSEGK